MGLGKRGGGEGREWEEWRAGKLGSGCKINKFNSKNVSGIYSWALSIADLMYANELVKRRL